MNLDNNFDKVNKKSILDSFYKNLDRSLFISDENKAWAYVDKPLQIGYNQTISQPSLVYKMTSLLDVGDNHIVLEIGTGSGYQTALLSMLAGMVYTVERITELSMGAQKTLEGLGLKNVKFKIDDGSNGWPEHAPYDRIMVTAAALVLPEPLVNQLKPNGRMIIPIGKRGLQALTLVTKDQIGAIKQEQLSEVTFVEFKGQYGWDGKTAF